MNALFRKENAVSSWLCLFFRIVIHLIQILLVIGGAHFAKNRKDAGGQGSGLLVRVCRRFVSGLPARSGISDLFSDGAPCGGFQLKRSGGISQTAVCAITLGIGILLSGGAGGLASVKHKAGSGRYPDCKAPPVVPPVLSDYFSGSDKSGKSDRRDCQSIAWPCRRPPLPAGGGDRTGAFFSHALRAPRSGGGASLPRRPAGTDAPLRQWPPP